jgi:hypothetical protein
MPIIFGCEQEIFTRLEISNNGNLIDLTIYDENEGKSTSIFIDKKNINLFIKEIKRVVNEIKIKNK